MLLISGFVLASRSRLRSMTLDDVPAHNRPIGGKKPHPSDSTLGRDNSSFGDEHLAQVLVLDLPSNPPWGELQAHSQDFAGPRSQYNYLSPNRANMGNLLACGG